MMYQSYLIHKKAKQMNKVILIILIILFISCNNVKQKDIDNSIVKENSSMNQINGSINNDSIKVKSIDTNDTANYNDSQNSNYMFSNEEDIEFEDADEFYNQFKLDPIFRSQRVEDPLRYESIQEEDTIKSFINGFVFTFDELYESKEVIYTFKKINSHTFVIIEQVEDTGIYLTYVFIIKKNHWYLHKIIDSST